MILDEVNIKKSAENVIASFRNISACEKVSRNLDKYLPKRDSTKCY